MKLVKLHDSDWAIGGGTPEEDAYMEPFADRADGVTDAAFDAMTQKHMGLLGIHLFKRPVPFMFACKLLYHVYQTFYPEAFASGMLEDPEKLGENWMMDDFWVFCDVRGRPVYYEHYVHGDCGSTFFRTEEVESEYSVTVSAPVLG